MIEHLMARINAMQEMMVSHHKEMMASMRDQQKEMKANREVTDTENMEKNPEEMESEVEHEDVPKEEVTVEAMKYRGQHLAVRHRGQPNKGTKGNIGSRKTLAIACRGMTCHAIPAQHKGHCCQGQRKDKVVPRTQKGWMFRKT
jgi:hypothetical protein